MRAKIRIETTVDVSKNDYKALEQASALELVQTAQMQGAKIKTVVENVRRPDRPKTDEPKADEINDAGA